MATTMKGHRCCTRWYKPQRFKNWTEHKFKPNSFFLKKMDNKHISFFQEISFFFSQIGEIFGHGGDIWNAALLEVNLFDVSLLKEELLSQSHPCFGGHRVGRRYTVPVREAVGHYVDVERRAALRRR